jgi:hypothetical protein
MIFHLSLSLQIESPAERTLVVLAPTITGSSHIFLQEKEEIGELLFVPGFDLSPGEIPGKWQYFAGSCDSGDATRSCLPGAEGTGGQRNPSS